MSNYFVEKGRFRVSYNTIAGYSYPNGSNAAILVDKDTDISYKLKVKKQVLGIDGIALYDSMTSDFFRLCLSDPYFQFRLRLTTDLPGLLATGSVSDYGYTSKVWGAKSSASNASRSSVGVYRVFHAVGSTNYTVTLTPTIEDVFVFVYFKGSDYFDVRIKNRAGTLTDGSFDYAIMGKN